jgi:hypothetical protein
VQLAPEIVSGDAAADVHVPQQLRVCDVAEHVLALSTDHSQP